MRTHRFKLLVVIAILVAAPVLLSCSKGSPKYTVRVDAQEVELFPGGTPMAASIHFEYAVYMLPVSSRDPAAVLKEALARNTNLKLVDALPEKPQEMLVHARMEKNVQGTYAPPDMQSLQYFGRGISREQAQALQNSREAFILEFEHPSKNVWTALRAANELVEETARKTGGLVWDEETREVFSPDAWHAKRLASWTETVPDITGQAVVHAYQSDEYARAITLGMAKAGLPDVVVQQFAWSSNNPVGNFINIFCQSMAEGATFPNSGKVKLDLRAIRNAKVRDPQIKSLKGNAIGTACLSLNKGKWEEGDPKNRLIELAADRYSGNDIHAKQEQMLSSFFGWEESIEYVRHTEELLSASSKARARLPELRRAFTAGLQPGEFIQVKAPFKTRVYVGGGHQLERQQNQGPS